MHISASDIGIQALGFAGILASILSFQCKSHKHIIFFRTMNELLFGIQYILLGAYTGAAMNAVGCVRNCVFSHQVESGRKTALSRALFSAAFVAFSLATWSGPKSLLIAVAKVLSTYAYGCTDTVRMRWIILVTSGSWLVYNLCIHSVAGMLCEAFTLLSIVAALVRIYASRRRAKAPDRPDADTKKRLSHKLV